MNDLSLWLNLYLTNLVQAASAELASDEQLRATIEESVTAFYEALIQSAYQQSMVPLHAILIDWIESRSAPTDEEPAGLLPVLATLKQVTWAQIAQIAPPEEAVPLMMEADDLFTAAASVLAELEAEALLNDVRRELVKAQTHIKRLDKNKSDFIAVAAHELKTPLTLIEGYTKMLLADADEQRKPETAAMLQGIATGTTRLYEIIENMIDVSLLDMRLMSLHFQPIWIDRLIDLVRSDVAPALRQRQIELVVDANSIRQRMTFGDIERLFQVFRNVVSNAVKYTPDGGTITITARDLPGFTDVQVIDTGIGIAPENLIRVFDKFSSMGNVSLHSSGKVKFKGGGPGLGLAIAKGIIEAHGGSIWAESPGYDEKALPGSIFHVMVPMRQAPPGNELADLFAPDIEQTDV